MYDRRRGGEQTDRGAVMFRPDLGEIARSPWNVLRDERRQDRRHGERHSRATRPNRISTLLTLGEMYKFGVIVALSDA